MKLIGNILYGQSGGPTSVINSSAFGLILESFKQGAKQVYACRYGIDGLINDDLLVLPSSDLERLQSLKGIPGAAFGSVRFKLPSSDEDASFYEKALSTLRKYNIRYFFYNGGNDSMDTCYKMDRYLKSVNYECRVIGIPKTVDNDLILVDHTPGYGSAAKYVADTVKEIVCDNLSYRQGKINIIEIMGRSAGWLAASAALATLSGCGPDLIYLPEDPFDIAEFLDSVKRIYDQNKRINVVISEGIKNKDGKFIAAENKKDIFGHAALGGVGSCLLSLVKEKLGIVGRAIELSIPQRAAIHDVSKIDQKEAVGCGSHALKYAIKGYSGMMVGMERKDTKNYEIKYTMVPLEKVANGIKLIDTNWIDRINHQMKPAFFDYLCPIVGVENKKEPLITTEFLK